jgi:hypothetical protein
MFMKTQQTSTTQVIVEIIDWPGASPVKALITTLGPAGVLPNVLRPSVEIGAQFRVGFVYILPVAPVPGPESQVVKNTPEGTVSMPGGMVGNTPPFAVPV